MLKIRSEQIRPFEQDAENAFIERVMSFLRENHADEKVCFRGKKSLVAELPENDLRTMVENGVARARSYGLTWKSSLISFVVLMFSVAPNFDRHLFVWGTLRDDNIPAERRIDVIIEQMSDEDWRIIAEGYDEKAWEIVAAPVEAIAATVGGKGK